jgi:hypothetical protein
MRVASRIGRVLRALTAALVCLAALAAVTLLLPVPQWRTGRHAVAPQSGAAFAVDTAVYCPATEAELLRWLASRLG